MTFKLPSNSISSAGITLGIFAFFGVILLASVQWLTKDAIAENTRQRHLLKLHEIVPPESYDNDLLATVQEQVIQIPGLSSTAKVYSVELKGEVVTKVFEVTSLEGYSGSIALLVGVNLADQSLRCVRVISHKETPGLGDKIETAKADWVLQFNGKSLSNPNLNRWQVKKDGGAFDQFTGATITPRAVVNAVRETLKFAVDEGSVK